MDRCWVLVDVDSFFLFFFFFNFYFYERVCIWHTWKCRMASITSVAPASDSGQFVSSIVGGCDIEDRV